VSDAEQKLPKPPRRLPVSLTPSSPTPIVAGVLFIVVGFVLIAYCWSQVALRMQVADQVPYVVSAGFTGIGLIVVGAMSISIQVRRRDSEQQLRRLEQLVYAAAGKDAPRDTPALDKPKRSRSIRTLAEPMVAAVTVSMLAVMAGFASLGYAWYRAADEPQVAVQTPYVVSGGLIGLALIGAGVIFTHILFTRSLEAERGDAIADIVAAVSRRTSR
jgi:hypothetical protein